MEKLNICADEAQIPSMETDGAILTEDVTIRSTSPQKSKQPVDIDFKVINEKSKTSPSASLQKSKPPVEILENRHESVDKCGIGFQTVAADTEIVAPTLLQKPEKLVEILEVHNEVAGNDVVDLELINAESITTLPTSSQKSEELVETLEVRHEQTGRDGVGFEIIIAEATSVANVQKRSKHSDKKLSAISVINQKMSTVEDRRRSHINVNRAKAQMSHMNTLSQKSEEPVENLEVRHEQTGRDGVGFEIIIAEAASVSNIQKRSIQSDKKLSTISAFNQKMSTAEDRRRCYIDVIRAKAQKSNMNVNTVIQRKKEGKINSPARSHNNSTKRGAIFQRGSSKFNQKGELGISKETCEVKVEKSSCLESCDGGTETHRPGKSEIKNCGDLGAPTENSKSDTQDDKGRHLY